MVSASEMATEKAAADIRGKAEAEGEEAYKEAIRNFPSSTEKRVVSYGR